MLSPAQIEARKGKLTASRISCLMRGDAEKIMQLYREMIGEAVEEDLSDVWAVRLGEATEALNMEWAERSGLMLSRRGEVVVHETLPFACTLDAWCDTLDAPFECKHVGGREPLEVVIDRYQPQMQWQIYLTGATQCGLSVIMGANAPVIEWIPRADDYIEEMVVRGNMFMDFVLRRVPPVALDPVPSPVVADKTIDMSGNNMWGDQALTWIETRKSAEKNRDAEKILKSLVPADAKKCFGFYVQITRDRAGRLSLREQKDV